MKILDEMKRKEEELWTQYNNSKDHTRRIMYSARIEELNDIRVIIHSHMEDEPASGIDKLDDGWIPAEYPPETNDYILLSFSNFSMPLIGRYEADGNGGAFYLGDCDGDDTCISNDLYVNAWQPLPKPYRLKED